MLSSLLTLLFFPSLSLSLFIDPKRRYFMFFQYNPKTTFFMAIRDTNNDSICNVLVVWCSLLPFFHSFSPALFLSYSFTRSLYSFCVIFLFPRLLFILFSHCKWILVGREVFRFNICCLTARYDWHTIKLFECVVKMCAHPHNFKTYSATLTISV